jgi:transposase
MPRIAEQAGPVTGGVDTHADVHVAAVVDRVGWVLGAQAFPADTSGYAGALAWMRHTANWPRWGWRHRQLRLRAGPPPGGRGGAGGRGDPADRQARRQRGKSDAADAVAAALAALNGEASDVPKSRDGAAESIRMLRVARAVAVIRPIRAGSVSSVGSPVRAVAWAATSASMSDRS